MREHGGVEVRLWRRGCDVRVRRGVRVRKLLVERCIRAARDDRFRIGIIMKKWSFVMFSS
jgi:hypothetical protein